MTDSQIRRLVPIKGALKLIGEETHRCVTKAHEVEPRSLNGLGEELEEDLENS